MNRSFDQVAAGEALPPLALPITATRVIIGASASRDWQPQHHDRDFAQRQAGTRDIFLNTPTQMGYMCRYLTDWSGPTGRIGRLAFQMKQPVCPGDELRIEGRVKAVQRDSEGVCWAEGEISLTTQLGLATQCTARVALPPAAGDPSPWLYSGRWQP